MHITFLVIRMTKTVKHFFFKDIQKLRDLKFFSYLSKGCVELHHIHFFVLPQCMLGASHGQNGAGVIPGNLRHLHPCVYQDWVCNKWNIAISDVKIFLNKIRSSSTDPTHSATSYIYVKICCRSD